MHARLVSLAFALAVASICSVTKATEDLLFDGISLTPLSRVVPGGTLLLQCSVSNNGESVAEATILVGIKEFPKQQSARRVVAKGNQQDQFDLMIHLPEMAKDHKTLHLTATMVVHEGDREVLLERNGAPLRHSMTIEVGSGRTLALAMQTDAQKLPAWYWPQQVPQTDYELAIAARLASGRNRLSAAFGEQPIPLSDSAWLGVDLFVISDSKLLEDAAVVESIRRYVINGGRLWVMLDLVPCELIRPLLDPHQLCEEVGRVELNDFIVEPLGQMTQISEQDRRVVSEIDIPMVRVVQQGGQIRFRVDGWPAAVEMNIGYGQIVLTTLGSRAWMEPRSNKPSQDPLLASTYQPRAWAKFFAVSINEARTTPPLKERVEYPLKRIGNPVVPRRWVGIALLGFFSLLTGIGLCLAYWDRLSLIGLVTPVTALLVGVSVLGATSWIRRDIAESVSRFQIIEISGDGHTASIREQAAVYLASSTTMQLSSNQDTSVHISDAITTGVQRLLQEDFQEWKLSNDSWPPGTWRYETEYTQSVKQQVAIGTLSPSGLHLQLPENLKSGFEDSVLSFSTGDPMLCEASDGGFNVKNDITIKGDRWIAGTILSDEQQRRLEIYRAFFNDDSPLQRPVRRLYGWTPPWKGASWDRELTQVGAALLALPVVLQRPPIGSEVLIPHGLIKLQRNLSSSAITSAFDDRTGKWRSNVSAGTVAEMQLVLPPEVLPIEANEIDLELDISAPQREVTIFAATRGGTVELAKLDSPSIPWSATVSDPAILDAVRDGTLNLTIKVSDSRSLDSRGLASNMVRWQIDHCHASIRGTTLPKSSLSPKQ